MMEKMENATLGHDTYYIKLASDTEDHQKVTTADQLPGFK